MPCQANFKKHGAAGRTRDTPGRATSYSVPPRSGTGPAEGRLNTAMTNGFTVTYTYNALGQQVNLTITPSGFSYYSLFGAGGEEAARGTVGQGFWWMQVMGPGRLLARISTGDTIFQHTNPLGSEAAETKRDGNVWQEFLYYPWGEYWQGSVQNAWTERFASLPNYEADLDLNGTLNRRQSPTLGRWRTPDPGGRGVVTLTDPQTWNMYAYARNNPTTLSDPSGLLYCSAADKEGTMNCVTDQEYKRAKKKYSG